MRKEVSKLDQAKRRPREKKAALGEQRGQVLSFEHLSGGVIRRVLIRQAKREMEQINAIAKITGGYLDIYPSLDQIQAFYEDGLEY